MRSSELWVTTVSRCAILAITVSDAILTVAPLEPYQTFEDYDKLGKVVATFYEALRVFPSAAIILREACEDTALYVPNPPGVEGGRTIALPKGALMTIDFVGLRECLHSRP